MTVAHTITLTSASREGDAALTALSDLAEMVPDWGKCRVVGGHMVAVHGLLAGTGAGRHTADADLAAPMAVLADASFAAQVERHGYEKVDGSRIGRSTGRAAAHIDLIAPSNASRVQHNQSAGRFSVDAYPGIHYALSQPPVAVNINAVPLEGAAYGPFRIAVPTLTAALVVKCLAASVAGRSRDRSDVHLLLAAADVTSTALPAPPYVDHDVRTAAEYLSGPFLHGAGQATRAMVGRLVPRPPERPSFVDL